MTDVQLLLAIRLRASRRLSNFPFLQILDGLMEESRKAILEKPIVLKLVQLCKIYGISLDEFDLMCIESANRKPTITPERCRELKGIGLDMEDRLMRKNFKNTPEN